MISPVYQYGLPILVSSANIVAAVTGPGVATAIIVSSHTSGTIKLWDSLTAANTVLVDTFTYATGSQVIPLYGAKFLVGLTIDVGGTTQKATVLYNPYRG